MKERGTLNSIHMKSEQHRKCHNEGFCPTSLLSSGERETVDKNDDGKRETNIVILHFNDVYNIEPREKEPVGGAARFATKLASLQSRIPLIFFSGDALNPSMSKSNYIIYYNYFELCNSRGYFST